MKARKVVLNICYKLLFVIAITMTFFAVLFNLLNKTTTYALSINVTTQSELEEALSSSVYDEIILSNSITLTNGSVIDGDITNSGNKKTIKAEVTGTTDQGVVNTNASNYTLFYVSANATVTIKNCNIKGGGTTAIVNGESANSTNNKSTLYIDNCQISNSGSTNTPGGGLRNTVGCKLVLTNSSIYRNIANYGAGFQNQQGTLIVDNCSISENRSFEYGGGGGENTGNNGTGTNAYMYIVNSTIANNTSQEIGGGINNCKNGQLYVINSIIAGNATTNGTYSGGGIGNNQSTLVCTNSILLDNVYLANNGNETGQDVYEYASGTLELEGCVYGSVSGSSQALINEIEVDSNSYQASESDSVFASTKTGSIIDEDGTQGNATYKQVALVEDENGVPYAPLSSDSLANSSTNSNYSTVKVEFDYSDLDNIVFRTGDDCSEGIEAPQYAGSGKSLSSDEHILTLTVFVNSDFDITGGTIYGDSYIVGSNSNESISLFANPLEEKENKSVIWASADVDSNRLTYISGDNAYNIDLSDTDSLSSFYDPDTNNYNMVLQPITMSLTATEGDASVKLNWSLDYSNTFCSGYTLTNQVTSYDVYYSVVNDFEASKTFYQNTTSNSITVTNLTNETPYYFWVVPKVGSEEITGKTFGYINATPEESGARTYVLASTIESGKQYLIVGTNTSGTGYAFTNNNTNRGTTTQVTVQTSSNTPYIVVEATDSMLWTFTAYGNYYRVSNGSRYIYLYSNTNITSTTQRNVTVTTSSIKNGNYGLRLTTSTPSRATNANVYLYEVKKAADAPTSVRGSIQSVMGEDSGTITGCTTAMEYSVNGITWTNCTSTTMTNMAVGKYYFRYKETLLAYASAAVTVEIEEKKIEQININTNPKLTYNAKDELDLSDLAITIIYNDGTVTNVSYNNFASTDSSIYQRKNGIITTSISNGEILECSDNGLRISIYLDDFEGQTARLTVNHHLVLVEAKPATCEENGNEAYYICDSCGEMYSDSEGNNRIYVVPTIYSTGHKWGSQVEENRVEPTCTKEGGYDLVIYCSECHEELQRTHVTLSPTGHTWSPQVEENRVEATCTEDGGYDLVSYCSVCHEEISRQHVTIPAHGHNYQNPEWVWDGFTATYQLTCTYDSNHKHYVDVTMTSEITEAPTCTKTGKRLWTATAEYNGIHTDIKEEIIAALGHNYGELIPEVPATCEAEGLKAHYHCSECGKYFDSDKNEVTYESLIIAALGHDYDYSNPVWNWTGYESATVTFICINDSNHKVTYDAQITSEITTNPTCILTGIRTYTATYLTYTDTKNETISALGHTPLEAVEENRIEATCEVEGGYDLVVYCDVCGC
ncbi:MAG: right-handed parallel beta-helix repeat-containing protein, partial [Acholeplasmatales bacterium]|nr:right-handed parallel beta-helix repeat-containing protein [Acholeplasmatales bacterium]